MKRVKNCDRKHANTKLPENSKGVTVGVPHYKKGRDRNEYAKQFYDRMYKIKIFRPYLHCKRCSQIPSCNNKQKFGNNF
jgi:hypothetical protein